MGVERQTESNFEREDLEAYRDDMDLSVMRIEVKYLAKELLEARERIADLAAEVERLREAIRLCDIDAQVRDGHIGTPAYEKIQALIRRTDQQLQGEQG